MNRTARKLSVPCLLAASMIPFATKAAEVVAPAAAPAAAPVAASAAAALFKEVDHILEQSILLIKEEEAEVSLATKATVSKGKDSCQGALSMEAITRDSARFSSAPDAFLIYRDIGLYYVCLAVATNDPAHLNSLQSWKALRPPSGQSFPDGGKMYGAVKLQHSLMSHAPDAYQQCMREVDSDAPIVKQGKKPEFCAKLVKFTGDVDGTCAKLTALMLPNAQSSCRQTIQSLNGQEDCAQEPILAQKELCLGYRLFHKAHAARNAELCGPHSFCRTLMGGGVRTCQPYAEAAKARHCDKLRQDDPRRIREAQASCAAKGKVLNALLDRAHAYLVQMDPTALKMGMAMIKEVDLREERISELREAQKQVVRGLYPPPSSPLPKAQRKR